MKQSLAESSLQVKILIELLENLEENETISYDLISEAIGEDIKQHRHWITVARRHLQRERRFIYDTIHSFGLKRMPDNGKVLVAKKAVKSIGRKVRRTVKILDTIDTSKLNPTELQAASTLSSSLGLLSLHSKLQRERPVVADVSVDIKQNVLALLKKKRIQND